MSRGWFKGSEVEFTGETAMIHGAKFYEVRYADSGKVAHIIHGPEFFIPADSNIHCPTCGNSYPYADTPLCPLCD